MSPGLALREFVCGFKLSGVRRIGRGQLLGCADLHHEPDDWSMDQLIAVELHVRNGGQRLYVVGRGIDTVPVAVDRFDPEVAR